MAFWELLSVAFGSAGLFASVLGGFLTYAARKNGEATRELIRSMEARMTEVLLRMDERAAELRREVTEAFRGMDQRGAELRREVTEAFRGMDQRADERHREVAQLLERMDQRADERHREVIDTVSALKAR